MWTITWIVLIIPAYLFTSLTNFTSYNNIIQMLAGDFVFWGWTAFAFSGLSESILFKFGILESIRRRPSLHSSSTNDKESRSIISPAAEITTLIFIP